jgi:methyl-accepting chemotaxis protein
LLAFFGPPPVPPIFAFAGPSPIIKGMSDEGSRRKRHPIKNFIIMPELQWPYIVRLLALINLAGVLMAVTICFLFYWRFAPTLNADPDGLEMINDGVMGALLQENLMDILVPAFIIADFVSLGIGLWVSLYFSRKISVPIYRVRHWAEVITGGNLAFRIKFRPGDNLESLEAACNQVSETYAHIINDLRRQISEADLPSSQRLDSIKHALDKIRT